MRRPRNSDEKPRKRPGRNLPARAGTGSPPEQSASQTAVTREQMAARDGRRPVNLALQGGGAHGAFTWGVLDRLLEDDSLALDAISATSAGAMNAVVMAHGVACGGREGGRAKLAEFWQAVSEAGALFSPSSYAPWQRFLPGNAVFQESSAALALQAVANMWSPYQFNPFDLNPLKDVLRRVVDFDHLQKSPHATRLFVNATNVRSGKVRIFENPEITLEAVLASA